MEIVLTRKTDTQVSVTCNNHPSHIFDLQLLDSLQEGFLIPPDDPVTYGKVLFQALFPVGTMAREALDKKPERLLLVASSDDLDAIPWEYTYGPDDFLVSTCKFVRGLPKEQRLPYSTPNVKLHIVAIPSHPLSKSLQPLNIEGEWLCLKEIIEDVSFSCTLERAHPPTVEKMRRLIANQRHRVVHFMGHGGQFDTGAVLCFEKENGALDPVTAQQFVMRVRGTVFLVTLNACVSASPGHTNFSNLAASLAHQKVPYALGMRFSIHDEDARTFSRNFYTDLANGTSVEEALLQARLALANSPRCWVIGVPVLYTALAEPAPGFCSAIGTPEIKEPQPYIDVSVLPRAEGIFQGRTEELKMLGDALTGDNRARIITIHGGGGQGKTALTREAVERFAHAWRGGIWATSLENLPSKATLVADLAHYLDIQLQDIQGSEELEHRVLEQLARRRMLIVLDNAETLVEATENHEEKVYPLIQFFQQLPSATISLLITSRTLLGWSGEQSCELGGLSPDEGAILFRQSAPQHAHEIDMTLAERLSEELEGHPLGLFLLGKAFNESNVPLHSFVKTCEKQLIEAENKYLREEHRHRKLYACIETSVRSLDKDLRSLLSGLWIFHSPFLAETAITIFDPEHTDNENSPSLVRQRLHALWQRGLLACEPIITSDGTLLFYHLLPTTRSYAEHNLEQAYEREMLLTRFGEAYSKLVKFLDYTLNHSALAGTIAQQMREDLQRSSEYIKGEEKGYYLTHLGWVLYRTGNPWLGQQMLERALEVAQGKDPSLEAEALHNLAYISQFIGKQQDALTLYEQTLTLRREMRDRAGEAATLNNMAGVYQAINQLLQALKLFEQALPITREVNNRANEAMTLNNMGSVYAGLGHRQEALKLYEQALPLMREVGDRAGEALVLNNLADIYRSTGEDQRALDLLGQSLLLKQEVKDRSGEATSLSGIADIYQHSGKEQEALRLYEQALGITREVGDRPGEALILNNMAHLYANLDHKHEAMEFFEQALPVMRDIENRKGEILVLQNLSNIYQAIGRYQEAFDHLKQCLSITRELHDQANELLTLSHMAEVQHAVGQSQEALKLYSYLLPRLKEAQDRTIELDILSRIASFYQSVGLPEEALGLHEQALSGYREIGDRVGEANTLNNQALIYQTTGQLRKSLDLFEQALLIIREQRKQTEEANTLNNMAMSYHEIGHSQEALKLLNQALPIWQKVRDRKHEAITLNNIGRVYQDMEQLEKALTFYNQALPIRREVEDRLGAATTLGNIATIYHNMGQLEEALDIFEEILPIKEMLGDQAGQASIINNLAYILWDMLRYDEALERFRQSVEISRHISLRAGEAAGLTGMAVLQYSELNRPQEAIISMEQALAVLEQTGLTQDATGNTVDQLRSVLQNMRAGIPLGARQDVEEHEVNTEELMFLERIVRNTCAVLGPVVEKRNEWQGELTKLKNMTANNDAYELVAFLDATIRLLDASGNSSSLGENLQGIYALAWQKMLEQLASE